jgi:hypothetical protein
LSGHGYTFLHDIMPQNQFYDKVTIMFPSSIELVLLFVAAVRRKASLTLAAGSTSLVQPTSCTKGNGNTPAPDVGR